ncbi:complex I intermediate-associated protein CIA30 [Fistulina hepatica ATCC 64428]|nr:complex I intermediate-associated protein CIA30 [Fistulina hepatica ATCC 64428]
MRGAEDPSLVPKTLMAFRTAQDRREIAMGCDSDIGGTSTAHFDLVQYSDNSLAGRFYGEMRLAVRLNTKRQIRGGYAGFQTKPKATLFGDILDDLSVHEYLALRVRAGGDPQTHNSYFVNIQTEGSYSRDIWQHRLYFRTKDQWEDVFIPLRNFVRLERGEIAESEYDMDRDKVRTVGISMLGGKSNVQGTYDLGIHSIRATNEADILEARKVQRP